MLFVSDRPITFTTADHDPTSYRRSLYPFMVKTVILIDDDQDDLDILKEAIATIDSTIACVCFVNPEDAIRLFSRDLLFIPDYIFTDVNMPIIQGGECVKAIRRIRALDEVVVTVLSTHLSEDSTKELIGLGANFAFKKPLLFHEYQVLLKEVFTK